MHGPNPPLQHDRAQGQGNAGNFEAAAAAGPCPRSSLSAGGAAGADILTKGSRAYLPLSASAELRRARAASAGGLGPGLAACRASWAGSGQRPAELVQSSLTLHGPARVRHAVRMFEEGCVGSSAGQTPPSEEGEASAGSSRLPELLHHWQQVVREQQQLLLLPTTQQGQQQPYGCLTSCCSSPPLLTAGCSAGGKGGGRSSTSGDGCSSSSSRASLVAAFAASAATAADAATEGGQFYGPVLELDQATHPQAGQPWQLQPPASSSHGSGGSSSCSASWELVGGSPATPKLQAAAYFGAVAESEPAEVVVRPAGQRPSAAAGTGQQRPRSPQSKLRASATTHAAVVATATALSALEAVTTCGNNRAWTAADEAAAVAAAAAWLADPGNAAPARQLVRMAQTQQQHKMQLAAPAAAHYVADDTIDEVQRMAEELLSLCQVAQQSGRSISELLGTGDGSDGSGVAATSAAAPAAPAAAAAAVTAAAPAAPEALAARAAPTAIAAVDPEAWQLLAIAAEEVADDDLADELARQVAEMAAAVLKRQS